MSHADRAIEASGENGPIGAIAYLAGIEDDREAGAAHAGAMRDAYWQGEDLALVVALGYAGITRCFTAAARADPDTALELRSTAKAMSYNLASFTWDGWGDRAVSPLDLGAGLAAAEENLRLAHELDKGDLPVSRALWMLGAHLVSAGRRDEARQRFTAAAAGARTAAAEAEALLSEAFAALCDVLEGAPGAEDDLERRLAILGEAEDGPAFVEQVTTAREVFTGR